MIEQHREIHTNHAELLELLAVAFLTITTVTAFILLWAATVPYEGGV